jgi:hypothetical protein
VAGLVPAIIMPSLFSMYGLFSFCLQFFDVLCVYLVFVSSLLLAVFCSLTAIPRPGEAKESWTGKACSAAAQLAARLDGDSGFQTDCIHMHSHSGNQATCLVPSNRFALFLALFWAPLIG